LPWTAISGQTDRGGAPEARHAFSFPERGVGSKSDRLKKPLKSVE